MNLFEVSLLAIVYILIFTCKINVALETFLENLDFNLMLL